MNRRRFLSSLAAAVPAISRWATPASAQSVRFVTPASRPVPGIIEIGSSKQVFLDDMLVHEASRISSFMRRPDKFAGNPILVADRPWEISTTPRRFVGVQITGQTVIYDTDDRIFKMWYCGRSWLDGRTPVCYATSSDGYRWEKPDLGIFSYEGSRRNNIMECWTVSSSQILNVIKDPHDPDPARRYKALGEMEGVGGANTNGGVSVAFSPDGLRWTHHPGNPVLRHGRDLGDAPTMLGWDPRIRKYVGFFRPGHPLAPEIYGGGLDHRHIRTYGYSTSPDFINWTPTEPMLTPDYADRDDAQYMQFTAGIDGEFYLGFNQIYLTQEHVWDVFLMSSRDGFHWNWIERNVPWIPRGEVGSYDAGFMTPSGPIIHDGKAWIYYCGYSGAHSENRGRFGDCVMSIALATLPQDRWMGLMAGPYRGTLVTHPVVFQGNKLYIDIEASTGMQTAQKSGKLRFDNCHFRAALEGPSGGTIEGFTIERSKVLQESGRQEMTWSDSDLSKLAGQPVRLRCEYRNAVFYSFQFILDHQGDLLPRDAFRL
jgi:hypothetical protein